MQGNAPHAYFTTGDSKNQATVLLHPAVFSLVHLISVGSGIAVTTVLTKAKNQE